MSALTMLFVGDKNWCWGWINPTRPSLTGLQERCVSSSQKRAFDLLNSSYGSQQQCANITIWETFEHDVRSLYHCRDPSVLLLNLTLFLVILVTGPVNTLAAGRNIVDSSDWAVSSVFLFGDVGRCDITSLGTNLEQCMGFHTRLSRALYLCLKLVPVPLFPWTSHPLDLNGGAKNVFFTWNVLFVSPPKQPPLVTSLDRYFPLSLQW